MPQKPQKNQMTRLYFAIQRNDLIEIKILVALGIDVNGKFAEVPEENHVGMTPLIYASWCGFIEVMDYLLSSGSLLNLTTSKLKRSALHLAVNGQHLEAVKYLLNAGALVNLQDTFGYPTCHYAADYGNIDILQQLINKGADVNIRDITGKTALIKSVRSKHLDSARELINARADVNVTTDRGDTALHFASRMGLCDAIEMLISAGGDTSIKNSQSNTSLMEAVLYRRKEAVQCLIAFGGDPNDGSTILGNTPLHTAIIKNYNDIVGCLLDAGCRHNVYNIHGESPAYHPVVHANTDMIQTMIRHNYDFDVPGKLIFTDIGVDADSLCYIACETGHLELGSKLALINCLDRIHLDWIAQNPNIPPQVYQILTTVSSLRQCARKSVRRCLRPGSTEDKTDLLPIPQTLKEFLKASEITM